MSGILLILLLMIAATILWLAGRWIRLRFTQEGLGGQLVSWQYGVTGKPDYIIERDGVKIPVLVKGGKAGSAPHDSHMAEVVVYCLLIEEATSVAPPYGVIRYDNTTFEIDYDDEMYDMLMEVLAEMHEERQHLEGTPPDRSHPIERRCYACRHCKHCEQSLVD